MRFKEFKDKKVDETIPAISAQDLKKIGPAVLQATKNAVKQAVQKPDDKKVPGQQDPAAQPAATVGASSMKPVTSTAVDATKQTPAEIPAIGTQVVLPDKDTKRPSTFTVKKAVGNTVDLTPLTGAKPTEPKISVQVNKKDLERALAIFRKDQ